MIVNALININERPIGSSLTATEGTYYLGKLNAMLESWSLERLMINAITQGSLALTSGLGTYTIGSGGQFNMARPTKIVKAFIRAAIKAGYEVAIDNGGNCDMEYEVGFTQDAKALYHGIFQTDEDMLYVRKPGQINPSGWLRFIYGNDGYDVLNDYTVNLEPLYAAVSPLIDKYESMVS